MTEESKNGEPAPAEAPALVKRTRKEDMPPHARALMDVAEAIDASQGAHASARVDGCSDEDAPPRIEDVHKEPILEDVDDLPPFVAEEIDSDPGELISEDRSDVLHAYSSHSERTVVRNKDGLVDVAGTAEEKDEADAPEAPRPPDWEDPSFEDDVDAVVRGMKGDLSEPDVAKLLERLGLAKHQKGLPPPPPAPEWFKDLDIPAPAPASTYAGPAEPFAVGDRVRVIGLVSKTEINGALGAVTQPLKEGRYAVRLEEPAGGPQGATAISAKPQNLEHVGELPADEGADGEPLAPREPTAKQLRHLARPGQKLRDPYKLDPVPPPGSLDEMLAVLQDRHHGAFLEILPRTEEDDADALRAFADAVGGWADPEDEEPIVDAEGEMNDHLCRRGPDEGVPQAARELILEIIQFDHVGRKVLGSREAAVAYAEAVVKRFDAASLIMVSAPYHDFLWNDAMLHRGIILLDDERCGRLIIDYDGSDDRETGGYGPPSYYDIARRKESDSDASDYEQHRPLEERWGEHQRDHHLSAAEEDRRGITTALAAADLLAKEGKLGGDHSLLTKPGVVPKFNKHTGMAK